MKFMGGLSLPVFILHGPIGQIFYKKAVAARLWGGPMPRRFFPVYLLVVLLCSHAVNEGFVKSARVQQLASRATQWLAARTEGMLQDAA